MRVSQFMLFAAIGSMAAASSALAGTVATFSDPAVNGSTPLFTFNGSVFSGGWTGSNLLLQTPDIAAPDFPNAQFQMSPLNVVLNLGSVFIMSGGSMDFYDQFGGGPLLHITFANALLSGSLGLGASDFTGYNVTFSGPILNGYTVSNESFSFSFANPVGSPTNFTVTSSFTSSADLVVPTPGTAALFGLTGLLAARRRR